MKRKGFTLLELLAVIVILAIIALISTPIIISVLERARKSSFEDSAYGIIKAANLYYANAYLDKIGESESFTFPNDTKLKITGEKPKSGTVTFDENGNVSLAISNGVWCAIKNRDEEKVRIIDYSIEDCKIKGKETAESCFTVNDSGETIIKYTCTDTDVIIPKTINGNLITTINRNAFINKQLTSVEIPNSITTIGDSAFSNNQLINLEIPNSVITIEMSAFAGNQLTSVKIPDSVTKINSYAFESNQLTSIEMGDKIEIMGIAVFNNNQLPDDKAFTYARNKDGTENKKNMVGYGGSKRENVIIPNNIISIGRQAFDKCQLKSVTIPNSVTDIGDGAFYQNQLTSIVIPDSVTKIESSAFSKNKLSNVTLPNNITTINDFAFHQNQLTNIVIPDSVTTIGNSAFSENKLSDVTLSNNITSIGPYAFNKNQLTSITIPSSMATIGENAFANNQSSMKVIVNKAINSITGSPWGASSVEWIG